MQTSTCQECCFCCGKLEGTFLSKPADSLALSLSTVSDGEDFASLHCFEIDVFPLQFCAAVKVVSSVMKITFLPFFFLQCMDALHLLNLFLYLWNKRWTFRLKTGEWQPFKWWASAKSNMAGCEGLVGPPCTYRFVIKKNLYTHRWLEALFLQRSHSFFLKQAHFPKNHMLVQHCRLLSLKYEHRRSKILSFFMWYEIRLRIGPKFTCNGATCRSTPLMGCCHRYAVAWPGWRPWRHVLTMKHTLLQPPAPGSNNSCSSPSKARLFCGYLKRYLCFKVFFETPPQWQFLKPINGFLWSSFGFRV